MAPVTRSRPTASSSKHTVDDEIDEGPQQTADSVPKDEGTGSTLQTLLKRALGGAKNLERENETLRKRVKALESKLERVQEADEIPVKPKRGTRTTASLSKVQKEVQTLKSQVRRLEKSKEKYRKRIHELSMREVKKDAEELVDEAEFEVGDSAYKMRKLLREFHDLMEANVIGDGEDEECAICIEPLELKKCSSLPCQHIFCNKCLQKIKPDAESYRDDVESIRCPACRTPCPRDELETIELTSMQQWDALLDVARKWAKIDMRRQEDTSEEEEEEEFIDDAGTNDASTTVTEHEQPNPLDTSSEPEDQEAGPQSHVRLRRRAAIPSSEPEPEPEPEEPLRSPIPSNANTADPSSLSNQDQLGTPPPEAGPSTPRRPSYSQSPRKDKRRLLEQMAEARSKKPRL